VVAAELFVKLRDDRSGHRACLADVAQGAEVFTRSGGALTQCCHARSVLICVVARRASSIGVSP